MSEFSSYIYPEEQPLRSGCRRSALGLLVFSILVLLIIYCNSCTTTKCFPQTEYITRDSIVDHYHNDTLIVREKDSIVVREKGDTVFVDRWRTKFVYQSVKDSTNNNTNNDQDSVQTETIEVVPGYYKFCSWAFWIIVAIIALLVTIRVLYKIYIKK